MKKQVDNVHTHIDLFSGIGGFALAARWAGIETIQFVEIEPFCQKVLQKNFPGVPIHDDIKTFKSDRFKNVGLITGGYPCQPFSVAGKRKGEEDDRHLWPKMFEIIQNIRPNWVICENVYGHVSMGLDEVLTDLENEAYTCQTFIVPACAKNAPHRRDRVWICAHSINGSDRAIRGQVSEENGIQGINREKVGSGMPSGTDSNVGNAESTRQQSSTIRPWEMQHGGTGTGSNWFEVATRLCRVDDGVSGRVDRLKSLGNAIVPQIAYEIMEAIIQVEETIF